MMSHSQYNHQGVKPTALEEVWEDLHQGMQHVYQHQAMSRQKYISLYTYPFIQMFHKYCILILILLDMCIKTLIQFL